MTKPIISVIGGTGLQGGGVVNALLAQRQFKVRVPTRNPKSDAARALVARDVEVVKADLLDSTSLAAAFSAESVLQILLNVEKQREGKAKA